MTKLLIDGCLHPSLVPMAQNTGVVAVHVSYMGLSGLKDWELMKVIADGEYTFVANNRSDFLALYNREVVHAGLIVITPNVEPAQQGELFQAALEYMGGRDPMNTVIEADYVTEGVKCRQYRFPAG
jgi:predicted nuclease of predicted toxin-antitoxin system